MMRGFVAVSGHPDRQHEHKLYNINFGNENILTSAAVVPKGQSCIQDNVKVNTVDLFELDDVRIPLG